MDNPTNVDLMDDPIDLMDDATNINLMDDPWEDEASTYICNTIVTQILHWDQSIFIRSKLLHLRSKALMMFMY